MRKLALLLAALGGLPAAAEAQRCAGQAPWSSGAMKLGGEVEIGKGFTNGLGKLGFGKERGVFAGIGAGIQTGGGDTGFLAAGGVGTELKKPIGGILELCPIANLVLGFGRHDANYQDILGGLSVGYPVSLSSGNVELLLTGAFQVGYEHITNNGVCAGLDVNCRHDVFSLLDLGAGFVVNGRLSLVPALRIPLGQANQNVAFLLRTSVAVGKH